MNVARNDRWRPAQRTLAIGAGILSAGALGAYLYAFQTRSPDFADVAYGRASPAQAADVYLPAGKGPFPFVIFIHGGAFKFGDKRGMGPGFRHDVEQMNRAGIALVSINYRMSGEALFPAAVRDAKAALRYLRGHAASYRLDPARAAFWGQSAGANIALMAGMTGGDTLFDEPGPPPPAASDRVAAIVSMYGPTDFLGMDEQVGANGCAAADQSHGAPDSPEALYIGKTLSADPALARRASPITYLRGAPGFVLLQHGTKDCTVPPLQSVTMAEALRRQTASRVELELLDGARHADARFDSVRNVDRVARFLAAAFAAPAQTPPARGKE